MNKLLTVRYVVNDFFAHGLPLSVEEEHASMMEAFRTYIVRRYNDSISDVQLYFGDECINMDEIITSLLLMRKKYA